MLALHTKSFAVPAPVQPAFRPEQHGHLAMTFSQLQLPLQVLSALNGFYIGTMDDQGPVSRESAEYWPTTDQAQQALNDGNWTQRAQP